jgi:hypothetical protein
VMSSAGVNDPNATNKWGFGFNRTVVHSIPCLFSRAVMEKRLTVRDILLSLTAKTTTRTTITIRYFCA